MPKYRLLLASLLGLSGAFACHGPAASGGKQDGELINGQVADAAMFHSTVQARLGCTTSKVGDRVLLLAAHCVREVDGTVRSEFAPGQPLEVRLRLGDTVEKDVTLKIVRTAIHPRIAYYCKTRVGHCGGRASDERRDAPDLAIIEVEGGLENVDTASVDVTPVAVGDPVTMVGYGCTGSTTSGEYDDKLRFIDTRIVDTAAAVHTGGLVAGEPGLKSVASNYAVTPGPELVSSTDGGVFGGLCPGDSGGPLYRSGTNVVVGVNASYTFLPAGDVPVTNWHARVDGQNPWGAAAWLESMGVKMTKPCDDTACAKVTSAPDGG